VVADGVAFVGGVGEAVLVAEIFVDFGVDFVERFFFGRVYTSLHSIWWIRFYAA